MVRVEVKAVVDVDLLAAGHRPHHADHLVVLKSENKLGNLTEGNDLLTCGDKDID